MDIESLLRDIERHNRGWLEAGNVPPLNVYLDGKPINHVRAVHRRKGIVVVLDYPFRLDKYRKRLIDRRRYGRVEVDRKKAVKK